MLIGEDTTYGCPDYNWNFDHALRLDISLLVNYGFYFHEGSVQWRFQECHNFLTAHTLVVSSLYSQIIETAMINNLEVPC